VARHPEGLGGTQHHPRLFGSLGLRADRWIGCIAPSTPNAGRWPRGRPGPPPPSSIARASRAPKKGADPPGYGCTPRSPRGHPGPRWRAFGGGPAVWIVCIAAEILCRRGLSGTDGSDGGEEGHGPSQRRDREAFGSSQRLCRAAQTMGGRENAGFARSLSSTGEGLVLSQSPGVVFLILAPKRLMVRRLGEAMSWSRTDLQGTERQK
jgi:hypothetical protein